MSTIENLVKIGGFRSHKEMNRLIMNVDLSTEKKWLRFVNWEGSKKELLSMQKPKSSAGP